VAKGSAPKRPAKVIDLMAQVIECVTSRNYLDTRHSLERREQRIITIDEIEEALLAGYWEKKKDSFNEQFKSWRYAIRGTTETGKRLRVVVALVAPNLLLITAIDLDSED
jgi:hypothetical protein